MDYTGLKNTMAKRKKISVPLMRQSSSSEGRKILVVDDNSIVLHVLSCMMAGADYAVTAVRSGAAALDHGPCHAWNGWHCFA